MSGVQQRVSAAGAEIAFEVLGTGEPLMLLTGLGGAGKAWGNLRTRFAEEFLTIVPDHRGTGSSTRSPKGYTIEAHAADMAGVIRELGCGPTHIVGSSTGGAIGQVMALDHPDTVRSLCLVSSWAGPDAYFRRQFELRRAVLTQLGPGPYAEASAVFLFSPEYAATRPEQVNEWIRKASADPPPVEIMAKRIDMVTNHDQRDRLHQIPVPTLVVVGEDDVCTPPFQSNELADLIPGAQLVTLPGGHLIYLEQPDLFFQSVLAFIRSID